MNCQRQPGEAPTPFSTSNGTRPADLRSALHDRKHPFKCVIRDRSPIRTETLVVLLMEAQIALPAPLHQLTARRAGAVITHAGREGTPPPTSHRPAARPSVQRRPRKTVAIFAVSTPSPLVRHAYSINVHAQMVRVCAVRSAAHVRPDGLFHRARRSISAVEQ